MEIEIKHIRKEGFQTTPVYQTPGSVALDLHADIPDPIYMYYKDVLLIPTNVAINIQNPNIGGFIYPRSGLGHKHGIILGNGTGIIDSDYQGEIKVSLYNRNPFYREPPYKIYPGDRIAQLVFQPIVRVEWDLVDEFTTSTERGDGGFGHTGA
jgi:dUTP pyrophosphatase